ncbi:hypothetical protein [Erythrobacter sp.]|uniref:hypothetical protein n=1 Tax=Erythrobacter sp. TaxID=1042 RepID=UPI0025F0564B|nr:hypothetical protein [Erythrobacter sp.]
MAGSTRRTLLAGLIGAGMAGSLAAIARPLVAADTALALSEGPMLLERELVRELSDGAAITVRRGWEIGFARQARGILVSGAQVSASVDAPPNLAQLAAIEQRRSTQGMFPILLSETGLILASGPAPTAPADLSAALRSAEAVIARLTRSGPRRDSLMRYLAEVHRAGSSEFEIMPADLFFPAATPVRQVEAIALPDGIAGEFALLWEARAAPDARWLAEGERQVITRIDGLERRSRELWKLRRA